MSNKVKGKVIPRNATTFKLKKRSLENDEWAVYTPDVNIQEGISSFMAERGEGSYISTEITYNGKKFQFSLSPFVL